MDIEYLMDVAKAWGIEREDLLLLINELGYSEEDENIWYYVLINSIFNTIMEYNNIQNFYPYKYMSDSFKPYINLQDTKFNNVLDDFNLVEESQNKDEFVQKLKDYLIEKIYEVV